MIANNSIRMISITRPANHPEIHIVAAGDDAFADYRCQVLVSYSVTSARSARVLRCEWQAGSLPHVRALCGNSWFAVVMARRVVTPNRAING
jgi:hypothetical protein